MKIVKVRTGNPEYVYIDTSKIESITSAYEYNNKDSIKYRFSIDLQCGVSHCCQYDHKVDTEYVIDKILNLWRWSQDDNTVTDLTGGKPYPNATEQFN